MINFIIKSYECVIMKRSQDNNAIR
jgi:hypothetical protein